jgi:hypothetical protein
VSVPTSNGEGKHGSSNGTYLLPQHRADLCRSGLSDQQIQACEFYSLSDGVQIGIYLGWTFGGERLGPCLAIPFHDRQGHCSGYTRLKPDKPRKDKKDGKPVRYESPRGKPNRAYFPPATLVALNDAATPLLITEGEKKAAKADQDGFPCIGLTGVYGWQQKRADKNKARELIDDLAGIVWQDRRVTIVYDSDAADKDGVLWGEFHLASVLERLGARVDVVRLPAGADGKKNGLDDFLVAAGADAFRELLAKARPATRPQAAEPRADDAADQPTRDDVAVEPMAWPGPLAHAAFHGLAGEVVRAIEPHSEADPVALLLQLLLGIGTALGRTAHFIAEDDVHYLNEFATLIGRTSKGRKGTSWKRIRRVLEVADWEFVNNHILGGLSSSEGLIWAVRDPIYKWEKDKKSKECKKVMHDPGVTDKRLLTFEPEFASVLRRIEGQENNTLSAILRQAWETGDLRTLVKQSPAQATGAHIGLIAHITLEELRRYLSATEAANGFANRFAYFAVKRSKVLPEGSSPDPAVMRSLGQRIAAALSVGRSLGELRRDDRARGLWREVYGPLSEGKPGLAGSMLARAEAHVMRLACLYAVLDQSNAVRVEHLLAALALWDYAEATVHWAFGDSLGDPLADELLRLLRAAGAAGMRRSDISNALGRNQNADRIGRALGVLLEVRLARFERVSGEAGGRPSELWFAVKLSG